MRNAGNYAGTSLLWVRPPQNLSDGCYEQLQRQPGHYLPGVAAAGTGGLAQATNSAGFGIAPPLTQHDVAVGLKEVMLRFAFSEGVAGVDAAVVLLQTLRVQREQYVPALHAQLKAERAIMPRAGRLALESRIRGYESLLEWTKYALTNYVETE
jgi:hypothetical protein